MQGGLMGTQYMCVFVVLAMGIQEPSGLSAQLPI